MTRNYLKIAICCFFTFIIFDLSAQKKDLFVGASSAKILPLKKSKVFLAGTKENRVSTGVNDPIYAKAVYLTDGNTSMALLSLDCIGLLYPEVVKIRERVAQKMNITDLDPNNIVVTSTHTHHAPDVVGLWGENKMKSGVDTNYLKQLIEVSANQIVAAWKKKKKANIKHGRTTHGDGWVANLSIENELDKEVSIIQFLDLKNKSIATMTNFACHTTVLNGDATLISSDYAGGLYKTLDKKYKGVNIFLQGAIGGWVQPVNIEPTYENAMKVGNKLGEVVINILGQGPLEEENNITFKHTKFTFNVENEMFKLASKMKIVNRSVDDNVESEISYFTIGTASFITHPGETSPVYSTQSKKLMTLQGPKFVIGLGNDALGYILKPAFFNTEHGIEHSKYLTSMSIHFRAAPIMMQQIQKLISSEK